MNAPDSAITVICEAYRHQWSPENSGRSGVLRFLKNHAQYKSNPQILIELCCLDMQLTWSCWAEWAEAYVQSEHSVDKLLKAWQELPQLAGYASLLDGVASPDQYLAQLASAESECRDHWGDSIGSPFYEHHFQIKTPEYMRRTRRHVRCEFESNDDFSEVLFPLRGQSEIGRQRTRDVHPYFFEANPEGNRIVVANRFEAEVSRQQLTLQLLSPNVAVVFNRSNVNPIRITPLDATVQCEQCIALLFPFTIHIPGRHLVCY